MDIMGLGFHLRDNHGPLGGHDSLARRSNPTDDGGVQKPSLMVDEETVADELSFPILIFFKS